MRKKFFITIFILFLGGINAVYADTEPRLEVSVPGVVAVNEPFQLTFISNVDVNSISLGSLQELTILSGPNLSTRSSVNVVNGKRTRIYEKTFVYYARFSQEGEYNIPPATITVDGKQISSESQKIKVLKQSESSATSTVDMRLVLELNKKTVMRGEPIVATLKLYTNTPIVGFESVNFPNFNGFWSQEIGTGTNISFRREEFEGKIYDAAVIRKYVLLPQQSGKVEINPASMTCQYQVETESSNSNSPFGAFFSTATTLGHNVSSLKQVISVSELPSPAPASFNGAVGRFSINAQMSKDSVAAHEAVSMNVVVSGIGNINLVEAPELDLPSDFELYDVKRTENVSATESGLRGSKTFEYPIIPRRSGDFELDPVEFTYYDIDKRKYITLHSDKVHFKVLEADEQSSVVQGYSRAKNEVDVLSSDIRFISSDKSKLRKNIKPLVGSIYYFILLTMLAFYFILIKIFDKRIANKKDVLKTKNKKASKLAKLRLKKAEILLKEELHSAFYEEMHKAIFGYIADKLMLAISDLSRDRIEDELVKLDVKKSVINSLFTLLDVCEYARYSPSSDAHKAMKNHYEDALSVISQIES